MEELFKKILDIQYQQVNPQGRGFASDQDVCCVMNERNVRKALQDRNNPLDCKIEPEHIEDAIETITQGAQRIFAILVLIRSTRFIRHFIEKDRYQRSALDHGLPFQRLKLSNIIDDRTVVTQFTEKQWHFAAPVFSSSVFTRFLPAETILPFTKETKIQEGTFGTIFAITIPCSHQSFRSSSLNTEFVRKEFKPRSTAKEHFEQELHSLSILRLIRHPNILEVLSCYKHGDGFNLIFPMIKGGTLRDILAGKSPDRFRSEQAMVIALSGLCSAISTVHRFLSSEHDLELIGCHHDLKPENILVQGSELVLADFGLAKLKPTTEGSSTPWKVVHPYYSPPECWAPNDDGDHPVVHRSSEIWSLGCIIAEMVTYLHNGPTAVDDFRKSRKYDEGARTSYRFHQGGDASPAVIAWLNAQAQSTSKVQQMLGQLVGKALELEPARRFTAKQLETMMQFIAMYSTGKAVQGLFNEICEKCGSSQAILEKTKFESWQSACGLLQVKTGGETLHWNSSISYDAIQGILHQSRNELQLALKECQTPKFRIFHPLQQLNNTLLSYLVEEEDRVHARNYLDIHMISLGDPHNIPQISLDEDVTLAERFRILASIRVMNDIVQQQPPNSNSVDRKRLRHLEMMNDFEICMLDSASDDKGGKVIVEQKLYEEHHSDRNIAAELHQRLGNVTALIKKANTLAGNDMMRVLPCAGFYEDPQALNCGLVYHFPVHSSANSPDVTMITLHAALRISQKEPKYQPPLEERYQLGHMLATSMLNFHKSRWLHRRISSYNISFFYQSNNRRGWLQGIKKPFFLGFLYSRSNEMGFTEGPTEDQNHRRYQHPEYLKAGKGYRQAYDYFSLGLVLLELGLWRTVEQLAALNQPDKDGRSKSWQLYLLENCVPRLALSMGNRYRQVVFRCLECKFEVPTEIKDEDELFAALHMSFSRLAVGQLARCC